MIDYRTYGLGCLKDAEDKRDYIYKSPSLASTTSYPMGFKLEEVPIKNQNSINSCVAHSIATIKEIQEFYETGKKMTFSVGFPYGFRQSGQYTGSGMYPKEALANLVKYGNVLANDFPENFEYNDLQNLISNRKSDCISKASKYKVKSYARVISSTDVKSALYINHSPVMIVVDVYDSFYNTTDNGIVPIKSGNCVGSHAMVIVGWTKKGSTEYYIVQNSWGKEWGDNGYCYIKTGMNIITDLYTVVDLTNVSINFSDVTGGKHWAEDSIVKCVKAGLINGYTDGTFKPNNTVTRAEIASMLAKLLNN